MSCFIAPRRLLSLVGTVLAVFIFASSGYAQGRVQGKVVDKDDKPIVDARVTITSETNNQKWELKTNNRGEYFQIGLPSGRYSILVEKADLGAMQAQVNVRGGAPAVQDFKIVPGQAGLTQEQLAKNAALQKLFDEAVTASKAGDHPTAIARYTDVAAGLPACADCYYNVGLEYSAMKDYTQAETAFKRAIELRPEHADAYNGLANVYNAQKKFDLASQASAKAAELAGSGTAGGGNADSLYNQGVIAWNAGKADEAKTHFQNALKADPNHAPSHFQLGMAYLNLGQLAEAKSEFETYLKVAPTGPNAAQAQGMLNALPK
jgi:tetratricopeptide (TPR) repeat protein